MNYFVYVIKSIEGFIYKGMTDNLERRLVKHNDKTEALKRERWLKIGVGREYLKIILDKRL